MNKELLEISMSSYLYTTATGFSILSVRRINHDNVTRFLSGEDTGPWAIIKGTVGEIQREGGVIIDDIIEEKPNTDEMK